MSENEFKIRVEVAQLPLMCCVTVKTALGTTVRPLGSECHTVHWCQPPGFAFLLGSPKRMFPFNGATKLYWSKGVWCM